MKAMRKFCSVVLCASLMCTVIAGCSSDEAAETNANAGEDAAVEAEAESEDGLYYGYFIIQDMPDGGKEFTIDISRCSLGDAKEGASGEIIIPEGVTSISALLFDGFKNITSVTIPSTVTELPSHCFANCSSLTEVNLPDTLESLHGYTFWNCPSLNTIILPDSLKNLGKSEFGWDFNENAPASRDIYFSAGIELTTYNATSTAGVLFTSMPLLRAPGESIPNVYVVAGSWIDENFEMLYIDESSSCLDDNGELCDVNRQMPIRQYWDGVNP